MAPGPCPLCRLLDPTESLKRTRDCANDFITSEKVNRESERETVLLSGNLFLGSLTKDRQGKQCQISLTTMVPFVAFLSGPIAPNSGKERNRLPVR